MKTGLIYKITNDINDKVYIGMTTRSLEERMRDYEYATGSYGIVRAIRKYEFKNFYFEIVEDDIPDDELDKKEIYYIKKFNALMPNGYNIQKSGRIGSIQLIGKGNSKPVVQIDPITLETISFEKSLTDMSKKLNITTSNISEICRRVEGRYISGGYTFCFLKEYNLREIEEWLSKRQTHYKYANGIVVYYLNSKEIIGTYQSAYTFAKEFNIPEGPAYAFLRGDRQSAGKINGESIGIRAINNEKQNAIAELKRMKVIKVQNAASDIELDNPDEQIFWNYIKLWELITMSK